MDHHLLGRQEPESIEPPPKLPICGCRLLQIEGSKLFVLFHPDDTPNLYKLAGETHTQQSEVDPLDPLNASKYPLYNNARPFSCVVATGEAVFIPKVTVRRWYHIAAVPLLLLSDCPSEWC